MPNPGNVTPYGNLVHDAAMHGGPDQYLSDHAEANYQRGLQDAHENDWLYALGIFGFGWLCRKGFEWGKKKIDQSRAEKREALIAQSERAEEAIRQELKAEVEPEEE